MQNVNLAEQLVPVYYIKCICLFPKKNVIFIYSPNFLKLIRMFNISQTKLSKSTFFFACLFFVLILVT